MRLSLKSKVAINSYLALSLAFFFPLAAATSAFATQTPAQQVTQLQADLTYYTERYSAYTGHYQQYAPSRMSELDTFASSLTTFSSTVAVAQSALTASNTANQALATAQSNVAAVPGLISTSQEALNVAQANYDAASASVQALTPSYSQALQERNDAFDAYQATVNNQSVTETFDGNRINTGIRFNIDGTTPVTTTANGNIYIGSVVSGTHMSAPNLVFQSPSKVMQIVPPAPASTFQVSTGAVNGNWSMDVYFTDNTNQTFWIPNGVYQENQSTGYTMRLTFNAPAGKQIAFVNIPVWQDYYALDNVTFTINSYNDTAHQTYLTKQSALDALAPAYNTANSALTATTQALASAQAAYNTYSAPSYLSNLESIRDTKDAEASAATTALMTAINTATVARTAIVDAYNAIVLPPTSLEVTSTADTTDVGTLRWAITQANAQAGGIYDLITIKTTQPIVLTSNLPLITQNVTITSDNRATSIIDGNALYTAFDIRGAALTLNLSNVTIQNTFASDWQRGSALWVVRGTANVTNVHFKDVSGGTAVTTKEGGSYINISNSRFSNNNQGVFSNHGGTPSVTTATDTQYDNRITITNTSFVGNSVAIYGERTVLVDNSNFTNNIYAFKMQGINKHRVTNSVFDGNVYSIYTSSWVPTSWTSFFSTPPQGRVIHNNIFKNNVQRVIILNDNMNDGKANQQGASIQGNSWDGKGNIFVDYSQYSTTQSGNVGYQILSVDDIATHPFAFSGNIDIAPRIDTPTNVQAVVNEDRSVTVTWTAPAVYNTTIQRYTIAWSDTSFTTTGWAWNHTLTSVTIPADIFADTTGLGENVQFRVRADNDTTQVYSQYSTTVEIALPSAPAPEPTPTPTPTPEPTQTPSPSPNPEPSPEPTPTPTPQPTPQPEPTPTPTPTPTPEPTIEPTPEPTPTPEPEPTPEPTPEPEPTPVDPTPEPTPEPEPEPTPTPEPGPTKEPEEPTVEPSPEPTPSEEPTEEPTPTKEPVKVEIAEPITAENIEALVEELSEIAPQLLTEEQQELIVEAALEVFEDAKQGSPEYEAALDALLVVAQADDIVVDEELAAVPVVGAAVVAIADALNALGNAGADMSPQVREQSEKVVIAAVIVGQVAMTATAAATSAAASAARRP